MDLPEPLRLWTTERQAELRRFLPDPEGRLKWTTPEQWHITLQFLGECSETKRPAIVSAMSRAALNFSAFSISLGEAGAFGGPRMGVIWLSVNLGAEPLAKWAARLQDNLEVVGFRHEKRPFRAHLTLARSRERISKKPFREVPPPKELCPVAPVQAFHLYQSTLAPSGARYTRLHTIIV